MRRFNGFRFPRFGDEEIRLFVHDARHEVSDVKQDLGAVLHFLFRKIWVVAVVAEALVPDHLPPEPVQAGGRHFARGEVLDRLGELVLGDHGVPVEVEDTEDLDQVRRHVYGLLLPHEVRVHTDELHERKSGGGEGFLHRQSRGFGGPPLPFGEV
eukprot:CAMPEP_0185749804 /NCGR_PEP_ID=MMETSP1174-20130828/8523_1 /TAXON_ID=35687 /ORGANISM="Dictyocha speculum, Strain CCMP1381" /LENGTH=154 /DNA_ID=CAMNT_0028426087 /DNA_START=209 /DNA_END=673 /DNA_ORIENTATION=-